MIIYIEDLKKISKHEIKKTIRKINKKRKKENIKLVLSKKLSSVEELKDKLCENNLEILDGRWLFNYLIYDALDYISHCQNKKLDKQNVCILANDNNESTINNIYRIAQCVKNLKIVTKNIRKFMHLEQELYNNYGIAIQISNNAKKSLLHADMIVNVDFSQKILNNYSINPNAIIINIKEKINIESKRFQGININYYKIEYNKEILNNIINKEQYDMNILYESYIYRKDTYESIKKQLKKDNVRILTLIGNNGEIYEEEYLKIS